MKRNLSQGLAFVILILIFLPSSSFPADNEPPQEVVMAAQEGINVLLKNFGFERNKQFGFRSQEEVSEATLGKAFQVFTVLPDRLLNSQVSQEFGSLADSINIWIYLIMTGDRAVSVLTVNLMNSSWSAGSVGAPGLARQLHDLLGRWPAAAGYEHKLIRVYQAGADFVEIKDRGRVIGYIPLISGRVALGLERRYFNPEELHHSDEILMHLQPVVRKNIQKGN